uniref:Uncharacterized protein n=1 Tax=Physcomitrium patens TaxID=3218 RepID=A0A2K1L2Z2_PHYPA|nr:hypothetical protein PHYPA_003188 [Physcomitrium patens]
MCRQMVTSLVECHECMHERSDGDNCFAWLASGTVPRFPQSIRPAGYFCC